MCLAQFSEVGKQSADAFVPRLAFEHMLADKFVETLDVFDGNRLVEDIHGFGAEASLALQPLKILFVTAGGFEASIFECASDGAACSEFAKIANDPAFRFAIRINFFYGVLVVQI